MSGDQALSVFEEMDAVRVRIEQARKAGQDVSLIRCIEAVLDTLLDADVTYAIFDPKDPANTLTPMMTERDSVVHALYTGKHERPAGESKP